MCFRWESTNFPSTVILCAVHMSSAVTHFDSWELHSTQTVLLSATEQQEDLFISESYSGHPWSRRLPESQCEQDGQQGTGAQLKSSSEQSGKLVLMCGQSRSFLPRQVVQSAPNQISTLISFHMQMCVVNFSTVCAKRQDTDYSNSKPPSSLLFAVYLIVYKSKRFEKGYFQNSSIVCWGDG